MTACSEQCSDWEGLSESLVHAATATCADARQSLSHAPTGHVRHTPICSFITRLTHAGRSLELLLSSIPSSFTYPYCLQSPPNTLPIPSAPCCLLLSFPPSVMSDPVHARFMAYSGFGDKTSAGQMDGKLFAKLCKETGIIDKKCTATDVDLIFARAKPKGGRKLDWGTFSDAAVMLAEKRFAKTWKDEGKEAAVRKLYELIAGSQGPQANAVSSHQTSNEQPECDLICVQQQLT